MNNIYKKLIVISSIFISSTSFSKEKSVNVVTWWGYLDANIIKTIEKKCNVSVTVDEYYSTDEFLRRFQKQKYSVVIFPSVVYNLISNKLVKSSDFINDININYNTNVLYSFNKHLYASKTGIFALSYTGFLYNPKQIKISSEDEIKDIFLKSKDKIVSVLDEPFEALKLISYSGVSFNKNDVIRDYKRLIGDSKIYITNDTLKLVKDENFAFSYIWAGAAYKRISEFNHLKFLIHPKLSYISSDLIGMTNKDNDTICVAKSLAGKELLRLILSKTNYFSPYGFSDQKTFLSEEYKNFFTDFKKYSWIKEPKKDEYYNLINLWEIVKGEIK